MYIYTYQPARGKPIRRAVNLGQKNDPTFFNFFTFSGNALETTTILEKVQKFVEKRIAFLEYFILIFFTEKERGPCAQTRAYLEGAEPNS